MPRPVIVLVTVALLATACNPRSDAETTSTVTTPATSTSLAPTTTAAPDGFGGEATIGVDQIVRSLNPFSGRVTSELSGAGQAVWATVYDIVPDTWDRVADAVTSLPSETPGAIEVADDGSMRVRYEVRNGATWSDGIPMSGEDIAFTAATMSELALAGDASVDPIMATVVEVDSVERVAWITFAGPSLAFEDALWVILPSHVLESTEALKVSDGMSWPSGGPFMVSATQDDGSLTLDRNPHYWKTDEDGRRLPFVDRVTFLPGGASSPGGEGSVDVVVSTSVPDAMTDAQGLILDDVDVQEVATPIVEHLTFQFGPGREVVNSASWNDSPDYREAIAHAIDRTGLLEETGVRWSPLVPGMLIPEAVASVPAWDAYELDVGAGASLVSLLSADGEEAVRPEAVLSTTGDGESRVLIGDALVGGFDAIGVDLETRFPDSLIFYGESLATGEFDIGMWAWASDGGYANQITLMELFDPASEAATSNVGNWGGQAAEESAAAEFSALAAEVERTIDVRHFSEIIERAEQILATELPLIPLFRRSSVAYVRTTTLSGVSHNGSRSGITWNIELWRKPGE